MAQTSIKIQRVFLKFSGFGHFLEQMQHTMQPEPGVWYENVELEYVKNRVGGRSLRYCGYTYVLERKYKKSVNWICNKYSNIKLRCPARCLTTGENRIKFSAKTHNHECSFK